MATFGFHTTGDEVVEHCKDVVGGKVVVITGASVNGLGAETAASLAKANPAQLLLLARSLSKVQPVIDRIKSRNPKIDVSFVSIELDKASSIEHAAQEINHQVSKIDILINNAGIMAVPYSKNDAGIELQLATNHIGHFLLTNLLMGKIKAAGKGSRIVNLTSEGYMISPFRFHDWNFSNGKEYDEWSGYGQSKTANVLFSRYLAEHLSKYGITSYSVHPGVIFGTSLTNGMESQELFNKVGEVATKNTGTTFEIGKSKTIQEGVSTTLVAALDPRLENHSGSVLMDCAVVPTRDYISDENAAKLWKVSEELVGRKYVL